MILLNKNYFYKEEIIIKPKLIEETEKKEQETNFSVGMLIIKRINIKQIIEYGTDDAILNKNVIGIHKASVKLDEIGNIILAGHNNKYVFNNLVNIRINDEIELITKTNCYKFKVIDRKVYNKDDYSYYKRSTEKILTLITCYRNNSYRLVVTAKES